MQIFTYAAAALLTAGLVTAQEAKQPQPKSKAEAEAIMAIFNAQDPDSRIAAADALLAKFADTEFKAIALQVAAASAQQKNDFEKMVIYAERTLEADPKNYSAMLMLANGLAQRTREFDLDREEKLSRAEKYANSAIEIVKSAPKPRPDIADEQWTAAKKDFTAQGYEALGLAAMVRKKYDVAAQNFKLSVDSGSQADAATLVRLASAYNQLKKTDEAIATLDKLNTMADVHPAIKQAAQNERNIAAKQKGGPAPAGGAATPSTGTPSPTTPPAAGTSTTPATSTAPSTTQPVKQ